MRHVRVLLPLARTPNLRWSMDFVSERLATGRWLWVLTVVDQHIRECLCTYAARRRATRSSNRWRKLAAVRGLPESITTDNYIGNE